MNRRLLAIMLGGVCVLGAGAGLASHYIGRDLARHAAQPVPLFVTSAQQVQPQAVWPPANGSVAFNEEMYALLTMGASASASARDMELMDPPRRMSRQERRRMQREERARLRAERAQAREARADGDDRDEDIRQRDRRGRDDFAREERGRVYVYRGIGDSVEVHVRNGRPVRRERVEREPREERPRAYAPSHYRVFGPFGRW